MGQDAKCSVCWAEPGLLPYVWQRRAAPTIPNKKSELVSALSSLVSESAPLLDDLQTLTVPELRQLFRTLVRGEKHPCDPTMGILNMNKGDLQDLCAGHGLSTNGNKGALCLRVRAHWLHQCSVASSLKEKAVNEEDILGCDLT